VTSGGAPAIGSSLGITGKGAGALALVDAIRLALIPLLGLNGVVRRRFQCPAFAESVDESQLDDGIVEYVMGLLSESLHVVQALDESEVESRASKASKSTTGEETESNDKSTNRSKTVRHIVAYIAAGHG
jgi:hypothetical protein